MKIIYLKSNLHEKIMCGIFFYKGHRPQEYLIKQHRKIQHRGPDHSDTLTLNDLFFGFHRLSINGLDEKSNQPMNQNGIYLICNGEIFNYKKLIEEYQFEYKTGSDCEIIIHLYQKVGIEGTVNALDGEYAFVLYDSHLNKIFVSRDHLGIRSLFIGINEKEICISSEMKAIDDTFEVDQFKPGSYSVINDDLSIINKEYGQYDNLEMFNKGDEEKHIHNIKRLMEEAVKKRLMSDRNIACLLSGGLDSTIVTGLVAKYIDAKNLNTYSIGLRGSVDLYYSNIAAKHFKTNHTMLEFTTENFIQSIERVIYQTESYDVTTIRASIGNYLVSCYIRDHSEDRVIFCGDVSDEIFGSYRGFYYAPNTRDFYDENAKMLENIHYFDVLRSDKTISGAGLEARVPFGDKDLVRYVMDIDPKYKVFTKDKMEKYLLRKAFEDLLPSELCWRVKTAFSDGIGSVGDPWHEAVKTHMETKYTDDEFNEKRKKYMINPPYDKESLYYREMFESYFPNKDTLIPYFWKQPFMDSEDPSAWCAEKTA